MNDRQPDLPPELESKWREWAKTEPEVDERHLKRNLLQTIPGRRSRPRGRLVLVAAAASLLAVLIGFETIRRPQEPIVAEEAVVHETGNNVILILREGKDPIYVLTEPTADRNGGER